MEWLQQNWAVIATVLFAFSEALDAIPFIHANSVWGLLFNGFKKLLGKG